MQYFKLRDARKTPNLKLNVGCGSARYSGWLNIDIEPIADLAVDVTNGLPFDSDSIDHIYCEHFLEHFTREQGMRILAEFYRCLKKSGVARVAVPDLDHLINRYNGDWSDQEWLRRPSYDFIKTKGHMINVAFRWWGHQYMYNEEDLTRQLDSVGFANIARREWGLSSFRELCNLETRKDTTLILEAVK